MKITKTIANRTPSGEPKELTCSHFLRGIELGITDLSLMRDYLDGKGCDYSHWPEWAQKYCGSLTDADKTRLTYFMLYHKEIQDGTHN